MTFERYLVLCWLCTAATLAYVHRSAPAPAASAIQADLKLNPDQIGWMLAIFYWGYAVFQIPGGWLADRWGTRRLLSLIALIWTLATGALALATGFASLMLWRFLGGSAQAGIFSCATRTISHWFPTSERGITSGFLGGFMSVGGALGALATGLLLPWMSWRWVLFVLAVPGLIWSVSFYAWFRDRPEERSRPVEPVRGDACSGYSSDAVQQSKPMKTAARSVAWAALVRAPPMWWLGGQQFFRAAGYIFYLSWFATFLQETRHVPEDQAAMLTSLPLWGVVVGSPLGGIVSDWVFSRTGSRRMARSGVAAVSMLGCALLIVLAYPVQSVWLAVLLISAGSFCSAIGGPCAYAATIDVGGNYVGTAFSVMNMCGNVGASVLPLVVPRLVALTGGWDLVLFMFAALYVAAGLCWMLVRPNDIFDTASNKHATAAE
jgi:sugar phosphate permease